MSNLATIVNNILADSGIDDINVVVTTGSYTNPSWIVSLPWTKITGAPAFVTNVTASSPLSSSGGTTPNITIQQASGSQNGFLSSTDWTTFNNKQNALTNPVTGTGTTNYLPKFTGSTTIGNSQIFDNGTNVGIGTASNTTAIVEIFGSALQTGTSPGFRLSSNNTSQTVLAIVNTSSRGYELSVAGSTNGSFSGSFYIYDITAQESRFVVNSAGNVGIKTTNPLANLQVGNGTQTAINQAANKIHIATNSTRSALLTLANSSGGTTVEGQFESSAESADLRIIIGSTSNHPVVFRANNSEAVRIFTNGNIGIGTGDNNASFKLDVNGTGRFLTNSNGFVARFTGGATGGVLGGFFANSTAGFASIGVQSNHEFRLFTNDTDRLTIAASTGAATFSSSVTASGVRSINGGVDGTFQDAFVGVFSGNNNEQNAIQTSVSSAASVSGFKFLASNGGGSSGRTTVVDFLRDRQIFYGNVGINNINPSSRLSVNGDAASIEGLVNINNTKSVGSYFPALKVRNVAGDHSFGVVSEFSTGTNGGDRPTVLFYSSVSNHSWVLGQVSAGWGVADSFGIGYRANNSPNTFPGWPSNYFSITTGGNVLIGTTTDAGFKLDVNGTGRFSGNTTGAIATFINTNTAGTGNGLLVDVNSQLGTDNYVMNLITNGTSRMYVREDGNVGINTNSPSYALTVGQAGTTADSYIQIASTTTGTGNLFFGDSTGMGVASYAGYIQYQHNVDSMVFGTASSPRLTIASTGAATFTSSVTAGGSFISSMGNNAVIFSSSAATTGYQYLSLANTTAQLVMGINNSTGSFLTSSLAYASFISTGLGSTSLQFGTNNAIKMTITSGGNVLIGTTSDSSDKLRVNGTTFSNNIMTWNPQNDNRSGVAWRFGEKSDTIYTSNKSLRVNVGGVEYWILAREV